MQDTWILLQKAWFIDYLIRFRVVCLFHASASSHVQLQFGNGCFVLNRQLRATYSSHRRLQKLKEQLVDCNVWKSWWGRGRMSLNLWKRRAWNNRQDQSVHGNHLQHWYKWLQITRCQQRSVPWRLKMQGFYGCWLYFTKMFSFFSFLSHPYD